MRLFHVEPDPVDSLIGQEPVLTWTHNTEPDLAGYKVKYRKVKVPALQWNQFTVKDITFFMPRNTGHYQAGVAAFDSSGNHSDYTRIEWHQNIKSVKIDTTAPGSVKGLQIIFKVNK